MAKQKKDDERARLTPSEALNRIYRYCAYQERSHLEVKNKLYSFGLWQDDVDEILSRLVVEGFLNEERFAKAFTGGKFRVKKWGKNKIIYALESKGLTSNCIGRGLKEIEDPDYRKTLKELILKKASQVPLTNKFSKRDKIARFVIAKGYEADLVWELVRKLIPD